MAEQRSLVVDCGGTNIRIAHFGAGRLADVQVRPTRAELASDALRDHILTVLADYIAEHGLGDRLRDVNIAIAGQIDSHDGVVRASPNLPSFHDAPLGRWVAEHLSLPTYLDNDARAAALGEYHALGAAAGRDLVCLTWGTGIGGGVLANGDILRGVGNAAGEIGHLVYQPGGRICSCRKLGCFEAYCGGWAIARAAQRMAEKTGDAELLSDPSTAGVFQLAEQGHSLATRIRDDATGVLGVLAANMVVTFNPSWVVLGGGIAQHYPRIADTVRDMVDLFALDADKPDLRIKVSDLGDSAALWGAALFAAYHR